MKKILTVLLAVVMVLSLVACGQAETVETAAAETSQAAEKPSESTAEQQDVTITLMASVDWIQDAELTLAEQFTEETGIKVDYQIVPSDQYPNLLQTKLNSQECTDIFCSQDGKVEVVSTLNVEKNAIDLSGEAWASTLDPTSAAEASVSGKLYGQPIQDTSQVWGIAYNKKIFTELNLSVPTNWTEFTAVCDAIKESGVTPIYQPVSDGWHHVLWFCEMGGQFEKTEPGLIDKLNNNEINCTDSAVMKLAIDQIKDMVDKGYWGDNYMADAYADQPAKIASGEYAMTVANQGLPQQVADLGQGLTADDIGYFLIPVADNQLLNVNPKGPTRFIYSGSENAAAAKQYLEFLARTENLQYMIDNVPKFMTLPYSGVESKYAGTVKEFYDTYTTQGTVLQAAAKYIDPQWMDIGKEIASVIQDSEDSSAMLANIDTSRADQAAAASDPAWQ